MDVKRSALPTFLRRLFKPDQMDYECDLSMHLLVWFCIPLVPAFLMGLYAQVHLLDDGAACYFAKDSVCSWAPSELRRCASSVKAKINRGHMLNSERCRYRHTSYHKQTKNQWARDDPAFLVVCMYLLVVVATAYCIAYVLSEHMPCCKP